MNEHGAGSDEPVTRGLMKITYGALTHRGMKRDHNEDNFLAYPEEGVFVVADGLGGHASGEIASRIACEEVREFFELTARDRDATWPFKMDRTRSFDENRISVAVQAANASVHQRSQSDPRCHGMGTTVVALYFTPEGRVVVAHAGDSRAYRFRNGKLERLTTDHSLVEEYVRMGRLSEEEAENFPQKNIILRALGQQHTLEVELSTDDPLPGDVYLLCSDGLSGMVDDRRTAEIISAGQDDPERCVKELIDAANEAGGLDNITCVLVRCG